MDGKSEIKITVKLDENNVPEKIEWSASDSGEKPGNAKAMLLSFWDENDQNTMRVDLWTKEMYVEEMKQFFHQNLVTMADTFERAAGETKMANAMRDFADFFGEELNLIQK